MSIMVAFDEPIAEAVRRLAACQANSPRRYATAESCTGGLLAAALTALPGSSQWFERGFVTYTNTAKQELLGVRPETLERFGAVSPETAGEMAWGALEHSAADIAAAVTGIAGPGGGTPDKPVGTVCIAVARRDAWGGVRRCALHGTRDDIRAQSVRVALEGMLELTMGKKPEGYSSI